MRHGGGSAAGRGCPNLADEKSARFGAKRRVDHDSGTQSAVPLRRASRDECSLSFRPTPARRCRRRPPDVGIVPALPRIVAWTDPVIDTLGHDPRSWYIKQCW
jgi:hypothetical protein